MSDSSEFFYKNSVPSMLIYGIVNYIFANKLSLRRRKPEDNGSSSSPPSPFFFFKTIRKKCMECGFSLSLHEISLFVPQAA